MAGRPSIFTQELAALICSRMADGESLRSICRDEEMPSTSTVFRWLAEDVSFRDQYTRAMDSRADAFAEEILQIADDDSDDEIRDPETGNTRMNTEFVARSRLKVDTRKWLMARMAPKRYGDKVTSEISGPDGGPIKSETTITEMLLVAVPIPERDADGYPIKKEVT